MFVGFPSRIRNVLHAIDKKKNQAKDAETMNNLLRHQSELLWRRAPQYKVYSLYVNV